MFKSRDEQMEYCVSSIASFLQIDRFTKEVFYLFTYVHMKLFVASLGFLGNCEEAFSFYQSVFGGEIQRVFRYKDIPQDPSMPPVDEAMGEKMLHIELHVDGNMVLMGADSVSPMAPKLEIGNNVELCIILEDRAEADAIFNGLVAGGETIMPMGNQFRGAYYGMCKDKYGINRMINCEKMPE